MINIRDLIVNQGFAKAILGSGGGSGGESANLIEKVITENGTYTPTDGVDGYSSVVVNVDPSWKTIFPYNRVDGFALDSTFNLYVATPEPFVLENGKTYRVKWDEKEWECTAFVVLDFVGLGNGKALGLPDTGEDFGMLYDPDNNMIILCSYDNEESHEVGVWEKVAESGGASCKCACGTFTGNGSYLTVEHSLGVVPDVIIVHKKTRTLDSTNKCIEMIFGISSGMAEKMGASYCNAYVESQRTSSSSAYNTMSISQNNSYHHIENTTTGSYLGEATDTSFRVGCTLTTIAQGRTEKDVTYYWIAIGGLT